MKFWKLSTREQVSVLKIIMPICILVIVLIYQLGLVKYLHEWGEMVHFAFEILLYGIAGPLVTFMVLSWLERQLMMKERAEKDARIERERREVAVVDERARIAREIHEGVSQNLYFLGLQLDLLKKKLNGDAGNAKNEISGLQDLLQESVSDLRRMIWALRPVELEKLGPIKAIETLVSDLEKQTGIEFELNLDQSPKRLSPQVEGALYRIAQESLNNIAKHSMSNHARLSIAFEDDELLIEIQDFGCGFDTGDLSEKMHRGLGLRHLRERAQEIGGWIRIDSTPSAGTTISAGLPFTSVNND